MTAPTHRITTFVGGTPDRIWQALTDPSETPQYYFNLRLESNWAAGSPVTWRAPDGSLAADGEVVGVDPGRRLEVLFHARWNPELDAEGPVRHVWQIEDAGENVVRLELATDGMEPGSESEEIFGDGLVRVVSGLKTLVETGRTLGAANW